MRRRPIVHLALLAALGAMSTVAALGAGVVELPLKPARFIAYEGKPKPYRKVVRLEIAADPPTRLKALKIGDQVVPEGTVEIELLPGKPTIEFLCIIEGKETFDTRTSGLELPAGWHARVKALAGNDGTCAYFWSIIEPIRKR